jgi:hypothetical protein
MTSGLTSRISSASTTKVYGRLSATLTIHIFEYSRAVRNATVKTDFRRPVSA